jgi:hypothetical protein
MNGELDFLTTQRGDGFTSASAHPELINGDFAIPPTLQVSVNVLRRSKVYDQRRAPSGILSAAVVGGTLFSLLVFLVPFQGSVAEVSKGLREQCAKRDALFVSQLEQHGERGNIPGEKLYAAYRAMLRARAACSEGRTEEGLALYDSQFGSTASPDR